MSPTPIDFTNPDDAKNGNDTSPGDYYYRVLRGIQGSAMENFGTRLRVDDIWKVVMFLKTIPNGGLSPKKLPTPDMYVQWIPNSDVSAFFAKNPVDQNKDFTATALARTSDPFMQEAMRDLAGMTATMTIDLPTFGSVNLDTAAAEIKSNYEELLNQGWADYTARGGIPVPPATQKDSLPDLNQELR
jgi:hypothetical protein